MKFFGFLLTGIIIVFALLTGASAQTNLPTPVPVPTQLQSSSYISTFPNFLRCSRADQNITGSSWEGVVIGESSVQDIINVILNWTNTYEIHARSLESEVEYLLNIRTGIDRTGTHRSPQSIRFCTVENRVIMLAVTYPVGSELFFDSLVSSYGLPSAISYDVGSPNTRLVFWGDMGVVARVFSGEEVGSFGRISMVIYFPPVAENMRDTWPFTDTVSGGETDSDLESLYGGELNPFRFKDVIATLTVEPTISPTPTFTPLPSLFTPTP